MRGSVLKKIVYIIVAIMLIAATGCGANKKSDEVGGTTIANPWVETDQAGILDALGIEIEAPAGAMDIHYRMAKEIGIAEVDFTYGDGNIPCTYRIKSVSEYEDISGLYYEWETDEDIKVSWCEGEKRKATDGDTKIDSCIWFDVVPGLMYSLSATGAPEDFDICALSEEIFNPAQGDVG